MAVTEDDLRDLLRSRSDGVPTAAGLADRAEAGARRRRALDRAGIATALVVALVATGLVVLPRRGADVAPVTPVSTVTHDAMLDGLSVRTTGPRAIAGTDPFDVSITVTNPGSAAWTGTVAVGVATRAPVPNWFDGGLFGLAPGADFSATTNLSSTLSDGTVQFQGFGPSAKVTVAATESRTWTYRVQRQPGYAVVDTVRGWVALADGATSASSDGVGPLAAYPSLTVTPLASNLSCATVNVTSWSKGQRGPWEVSSAYHALVGADRAPTWTPLRDVEGTTQQVVTTAGADVRVTTVVAALQAKGAGTSVYPSEPELPTRLAPGEYIAFAGERMVPVTFVGTCGPSGSAISGTWTSVGPTGEGILDCTVTPQAGTMAATVTQYCRR